MVFCLIISLSSHYRSNFMHQISKKKKKKMGRKYIEGRQNKTSVQPNPYT